MKNSIISFVCAMALSTSFVFANNSNETNADLKSALPATTPTIETPAPQNAKTVNEYTKYTPAQKAAIVELKVSK
jgi:hypothetical protein